MFKLLDYLIDADNVVGRYSNQGNITRSGANSLIINLSRFFKITLALHRIRQLNPTYMYRMKSFY